jgi:hypothetical protein
LGIFQERFLDFPLTQDLFESRIQDLFEFLNEKSRILKALNNLGKKCLKVRVSYLVSGIILLTKVLSLLSSKTPIISAGSSTGAGRSIRA